MKKWFSYIRNHHQDIFRVFLMYLAILIITSQYPQFGAFKYDFEQGKPWGYEDLTAPASFPIKKSDEELQKEREQMRSEVAPYYVWRSTVAEAVKVDFGEDLIDELGNLSGQPTDQFKRDSIRALSKGTSMLRHVYERGVIRLDDGHKPYDPTFKINLVQDNELSEVRLERFYSEPQALKYIDDQLAEVQGHVRQILTATLKRNLQPNVVFDSATTNRVVREALNQISEYRGAVQKDEAIIRYGEIVTPEKYQKLVSLRKFMESQYGERNRLMVAAGYFLVTALLLTIFGFFVFNFSPDVFRSTRKILFILVLIVGMLLIVSWAAKAEIPSYYVLPFCIVPITLRTFFGTRLSLYAHLITVLLAGFFLPVGIEYITLNLVAGMVAIFTNIKVHYWSQFFITIGFILLTYVVGFMGIVLIQEGSFMQLQWLDFGWLSINVFLTLLAYPLIPIFEKLFGYVSDITLMELGDLNKPLLKDLQIKAPGTFQHSLQVSNLAEAAASEIGANALLVKVGSLYHDIGKMQNPVYFIENQSTKYNPHDNLPFDESAKVIIAHVKKGVDLAKKHNLPDILIDFIRTHHGTSRVEYFYRSYIKSFPESDVDENIFKYPGPLPYSKETAVVMMADTVEATARSMKEPTAETLDKLVDNLVNSKVEQQQFVKSNITFKEIEEVKAIFKKMLKSIYHVRIEYPDK
jgi:putative nucleotidyltransferase with HDIG domain